MARFIGYPARKVLAVLDSEAAADRAIAALHDAGLAADAVERLSGAPEADRFDATGARHGPIARLLRVVQFGLMDQMPAMAWYEEALRAGRVVVAVAAPDRDTVLRAVGVLRENGAHFINGFGRFATEEFARWRGPEPGVPDLMKH